METPKIVNDIIKFSLSINGINDREFWKRIRIAISGEELKEIIEWTKTQGRDRGFIYAIRGFPIHVELCPTKPQYIQDMIDAPTS